MSTATPPSRDRDDRPATERSGPGARPVPEHHRVPGAEILFEDTWADEPETCPECGAVVAADSVRCPKCSQWLSRCGRSCPSCASPRCVGGGRVGP